VNNNYLDLGMNQSGFVHTLPNGRRRREPIGKGNLVISYWFPINLNKK
jgi:hypothetical protein